ncbi:MAG: MBL fold metallo-hydrolase [Candidatus Nanoarchaeia archaeon]
MKRAKKTNIKIKKISKGIFCITELDYIEHCNCYLIIGTKRCLLVDAGIGLIDFDKLLKPLIQNKKLDVIITHLHFDHFLGAKQNKNMFKKIYAHLPQQKLEILDIGLKYFNKKDFKNHSVEKINIKRINMNNYNFVNVNEGHIFDLGNLKFKIILTPGHCASGVALFEENKKILISGDTIYAGKLIYDFEDSNKEQYLESISKLLSLKPKIILGGHNKPIILN